MPSYIYDIDIPSHLNGLSKERFVIEADTVVQALERLYAAVEERRVAAPYLVIGKHFILNRQESCEGRTPTPSEISDYLTRV